MKKIVVEDETQQTLYILTDTITPSRGCDYQKVFKESYDDRINKYASVEHREIINKAIADHPGWKISEFCYPC